MSAVDHQQPAVESTATEIVRVEPVQPVAPAPANLFRTDDPVDVVKRASEIAAALKDVLREQGMVQQIHGREHVKVEGWQTLGSMLGLVPVVVWTREIEGGWEARVEARTLDGRVVGAAEAMCTRAESHWRSRDAYALRSMAQTRATSKALRGPLGFIVTLAGYEATPAEEMPANGDAGGTRAEAPARAEKRISGKRAAELAQFAVTVGVDKLQLAASHVHGQDVGDCSTIEAATRALSVLTASQADQLHRWISRKAEELAEHVTEEEAEQR